MILARRKILLEYKIAQKKYEELLLFVIVQYTMLQYWKIAFVSTVRHSFLMLYASEQITLNILNVIC